MDQQVKTHHPRIDPTADISSSIFSRVLTKQKTATIGRSARFTLDNHGKWIHADFAEAGQQSSKRRKKRGPFPPPDSNVTAELGNYEALVSRAILNHDRLGILKEASEGLDAASENVERVDTERVQIASEYDAIDLNQDPGAEETQHHPPVELLDSDDDSDTDGLHLSEHDEDETTGVQSFAEPSYAYIEAICNRYFPHVLKIRAPPPAPSLLCGNPVCLGDDDPLKKYTCDTCFQKVWYCSRCIVERHTMNPFHRIIQWDLSHYSKKSVSLLELGLIVRFQNEQGRNCECSLVTNRTKDLEVYDSNGLHRIRYHLCGGGLTATPEVLLTNNLYPATDKEPTRAFTHQLLSELDILNLHGYINIKQFIDIKFNTTPSGQRFKQISGRLRKDLHEALRFWRLFKRMQELGYRAIFEMMEKGAVSPCPACPLPDVNIPDRWNESERRRLLYSTIISGDGNFHLQQMLRAASLLKDPSFFGDTAFFTPYKASKSYINNALRWKPIAKDVVCGTQAGTSTKDRPSSKFSTGGVFAMQCKHGLYLSKGLIDFPKGERFDIVDVPFQYQVQKVFNSGLQDLVLLYDVSCKYKVNVHKRCSSNETPILDQAIMNMLKDENFIRYFVNVWHGYSHKPECSDFHSLRNAMDVGLVTGEEIESGWAKLNHLQYSTREMSSGGRADMITAHMLQINKDKVDGMSDRLVKKLTQVCGELVGTLSNLKDLEDSIEARHPGTIETFKREFERRGGEQFRPNSDIFKYPTVESQMRRIDIEDQNRPGRNIKELGGLAERGIELTLVSSTSQSYGTSVLEWNNEVYDFLPTLETIITEPRVILLPSNVGSRHDAPAYNRWAQSELMLRVGKGHELLQQLRVSAAMHSWYLRRQRTHSRGREAMLSVSNAQKRTSSKKANVIKQYISNWVAIERLIEVFPALFNDRLHWLKGLQRLNPEEDVHFFETWGSRTGEYVPGNGLRVSWVWKVAMEKDPGEVDNYRADELQESWEREASRLEWVHSFARNERCNEEVILVSEELRRLGQFQKHEVKKAREVFEGFETDSISNNWAELGFLWMSADLMHEGEARLGKLHKWAVEGVSNEIVEGVRLGNVILQ